MMKTSTVRTGIGMLVLILLLLSAVLLFASCSEADIDLSELTTTGADGKSAYEIAIENGFTGTEAEWLASLVGQDGATGATGSKGDPGADGKSAYEIAIENGFTGTEAEWLASLVGQDGAAGATGSKGDPGADGVSVVGAEIDESLHLWIRLSDGSCIDAGYVGVNAQPSIYSVIFYDYDGSIIDIRQVEAGGTVTAPADPARAGYTFTGWSGTLSGITGNTSVTATYQRAENQLFFRYTDNGDGTTTVTLSMCGNLEVCGFQATLLYQTEMAAFRSVEVNTVTGIEIESTTNADGSILFYFNDKSGGNVATSFDILSITFENTGSPVELTMSLVVEACFNAANEDVSYTVANTSYAK